jgi:hypothetical protein
MPSMHAYLNTPIPPPPQDFEYFNVLVNATRGLRSDYGLTRQRPVIYVASADPARRAVLRSLTSDIATLTTSGEVHVIEAQSEAPPGGRLPGTRLTHVARVPCHAG